MTTTADVRASGEQASAAARPTRQERRRDATRTEILDAAWTIVRRDGLGALSLRDLGAQVGMRAQSLYSYFPSKHAIFDAMFRHGYEQLIAEVAVDPGDLSADGFTDFAHRQALAYFDFCVADPVRYQLLFQRTIPGFEPSPASYAVAVDAYDRTVGQLRRAGATTEADADLWTGVITGLVSQQLANDPGGTRWRDLVPRAVDLLLADISQKRSDP